MKITEEFIINSISLHKI